MPLNRRKEWNDKNYFRTFIAPIWSLSVWWSSGFPWFYSVFAIPFWSGKWWTKEDLFYLRNMKNMLIGSAVAWRHLLIEICRKSIFFCDVEGIFSRSGRRRPLFPLGVVRFPTTRSRTNLFASNGFDPIGSNQIHSALGKERSSDVYDYRKKSMFIAIHAQSERAVSFNLMSSPSGDWNSRHTRVFHFKSRCIIIEDDWIRSDIQLTSRNTYVGWFNCRKRTMTDW